MSNTLSKKFWSVLAMLVVVGAFLFALTTSAAVWTPPTPAYTFPNNIDAPIHMGSVEQGKGANFTGVSAWAEITPNFIGADNFIASKNISAIDFIASKKFCLVAPSNIGGINYNFSGLWDGTPNPAPAVDCITSWPTGGTTGTELWTDLGTTLQPTDNRDILVSGTSFGGTGDSATVYLGDTNHSVRSDWGLGLVFDTFGVTDPMVIQQNTGYVGIGITAPTQKLDVSGTVKATGLNVITGPWNSQKGISIDSVGVKIFDGINIPITGQTVLTRQSNGSVKWEAVSGGGTGSELWTATGNNISNTNSGNVKVGASTQNYKFNVLGTSYLEGRLVAPKEVILSNDSGVSNNTKIGDPNSAPSNDTKLFVYGKTQLGNSTKILGSLDVTGSIRNRPGSGVETILGPTQYPNGGAYNVSIDDPFYVSNDTTLSGKVKIDGKVRIVGGNPGTNKVLTSINTSGDAEWRSSVSDIKMVEGHWFLADDGNSFTLSCPANYKAIAVACDSSGDRGADACRISPWNGIDGDTGTVPYRETNWSTSGGLYAGAVGSPDNNDVEFVMQVTCMRYQ